MLENDSLGHKIIEMIAELLRNNQKVLECMSFEEICPFIDKLRNNQNFRYLEYLETFCVCNGEPMVQNQIKIGIKWLTEDQRGVFLTDRGQNLNLETNVIYIKTQFDSNWMKLHEFLDDNNPLYNQDNKDYFLKQIDLLLALCYGRNQYCIDLIINKLNYISWEQCYAAINSHVIPAYMKTKFFEIIQTMFIDVGRNYAVIDSPKFNFIFSQIQGDVSVAVECMFPTPSELVTSKIFRDLSEWIYTFLESTACMISANKDYNYLLRTVFITINKLIQYGYYDSPSLVRICKSLLKLLNGKLDLPFEYDSKKDSTKIKKKMVSKYKSKSRYEDSVETRAIVAAKLAGLEILDSILIYERVSVVSKLISRFKKCVQPDSKIQKKRLTGHTHLMECLSPAFDVNEQYTQSTRATKKMVSEIDNLFTTARFLDSDQWTNILIDLAHYQNDMMTQKSLLILHKLYSMKESSFQDTYATFVSKTKQSQDLQELLCEYIPALKLITKSIIVPSDLEKISTMVTEMINVCKIPKSDSLNPISQRIIVGYGILDIAMETIFQIYRSFDKTKMNYGASDVISLITDLLKHLSVANPSFQENLFNNLDSLLDLYEHSPPSQLADLLRYGLFHNNRVFCGRVKSFQINKIVLMVADTARKNPLIGTAFIHLLESLVAVDNGEVPLKRNQLIVMKFVMKSFNQIVYLLDSKAMSRVDLLTIHSSSNDALYFTKIIDLFIACCQGENQYVQSLCQTIMPLDELFELLTHNDISIIYKRGLLKYFCRVYLSKTSISNQEGKIKTFIDSKYCGEILQSIERTTLLTQIILDKTEHFNLLPILKKEFILRPPTEFQVAENIQMHLHYIIFGSSIFMASLCSVFTTLEIGLPPELSKLVKSINHKMMDIFSLLWKFQLHPSIFSVVTQSVLQIITYSETSDLEAKTMALQHCKPQIMDYDPRKEIDGAYAEEIELNLKLQTFIFNCSQLIAGQNTVKSQIKAKKKKQYVNLFDQNSLPLNLEFQNHLKCFIINTHPKGEMKRYRFVDILIRQLEISGDIQNDQKRQSKVDKNSFNPTIKRLDQDSLDLRSLQILRGLIYNEECLLPDDWEMRILDSSVQENLKCIKNVQNCLNKLNLSSRTQIHMVNSCDSVKRESIILQSAMLMNANKNVQESLLKYFKGAQEEVFFSAIKHQLQNAFNDLKDQKLMISQRKSMADIEKYSSNETDLRIDNLAVVLYQQLSDYEVRYEDQNKNLAINESFMTRQMRQIYAPEKVKNEITVKTPLLCCPQNINKSHYDMKSIEKSDSFYQNNLNDEYELKSVVTKESISSTEKTQDNSAWIKGEALELMRNDPHQNVKLILQLLSRMCVGQYQGLQNYLRTQPDNRTSVDVVSMVVQFLGNIYANVRHSTIDLNIQAFDTIKETIMGNQENRSVVYRAKVVDYANFILRNDEISENCDMHNVIQLFLVIGRVIMALIEENGKDETELAKEIKITLDIKAVFKTMSRCLEMMEKTKEKLMRNKIYDVGFTFFLILARLEDLCNGKLFKDFQINDQQMKAFRYFKKGSISIEILKGDQLQRIHFRLKRKEVLRESVKEKVKWEVDRTTPSNKIRSFITWSKLILPDMRFQRKVIRYPLLLFITKQWNAMNYFLTLLSLVINILLLIGVKAPDNGFIDLNGPGPDKSSAFNNYTIIWKPQYIIFQKVVKGLGISHAVIAFLILVTYLITVRPAPKTIRGHFKNLQQKFVSLFKKQDESDSENVKNGSDQQVSLFSFMRFFYCCISLAMSLGGIWYPYLYVFHMFNVIHNNQLLKGVIASVTKNGRVLIWVMILMVVVMYIFSIFAFCFLRSTFNAENYMYADTLVQTFVSLIRFGIVGDLYQYTVPHSHYMNQIDSAFTQFSIILIFQLFFFIFITITGLNIIFGIIVDTFSELRDLKYKTEKDMQESCFICSRAGHDFDQSSSSFQHHVAQEHNMWAYLFYFLHLREIKINDYFHLDLYVSNMLLRENYDFFPINCALSLTKEQEKYSRIDEITRNVKIIINNRQNEEREKLRRTNLLKQSQWQKQYQNSRDSSSSYQDLNMDDMNFDNYSDEFERPHSLRERNQPNMSSLEMQSSSQPRFKSPRNTPSPRSKKNLLSLANSMK